MAELKIKISRFVNAPLRSSAAGDDKSADSPVSAIKESAYYHFDSKGNKLRNKWDSFDVDAELSSIEAEEKRDEQVAPRFNRFVRCSLSYFTTIRFRLLCCLNKIIKLMSLKAAHRRTLNAFNGLERDVEKVLHTLDQV